MKNYKITAYAVVGKIKRFSCSRDRCLGGKKQLEAAVVIGGRLGIEGGGSE